MYYQKGRMSMLVAVIIVTFICNHALLADPITGSGTANYIPKFSGIATIDNSVIYQSGNNIGIGTTNPTEKLVIGTDLGTNSIYNRLVIGGSDQPGFYIGQSSSNNLVIRWLYNETASNAYASFNTYGYNNPLYIDASTVAFQSQTSGNVGIGTTSPSEKLTVKGNILILRSDETACLELGEGLDYAEGFDLSEPSKNEPGSVLIIDSENPGKLTLCSKAYDTKVAGIAAGAKELGSGVRLGVGQFDCDVALAGRVYCNVDATEYAIQPGDLLTTSNTPGYAMKAHDFDKAKGATLGKAMEGLEKGEKGQILVLVTLQ